jgi:hypothetical protein
MNEDGTRKHIYEGIENDEGVKWNHLQCQQW